MRIVQTLWSCNRSLLEDAFGWMSPEHHLMSWALSCLSLKEHYQDIILYTDSQAADILTNKIGLPYSDVMIAYDQFDCLPRHWALAKIKTYSMQQKPFLHVDGDIYLPRPLPKRIERSRLAAQNREYGTSYYKSMMDRLLACPGIRIPHYLEKGLREESVSSYNMGFFGGTDLDFIRRYCEEVFRFFEENRMNDPACSYSAVNCNVIFEQVFFAVLADNEKRKVATVLRRAMRDEGYTGKEFCDVVHFNRHGFFHLLGGHKLDSGNCRSLEMMLIRKYPETYKRILNLFDKPPMHPVAKIHYVNKRIESAAYNDFVRQAKASWDKVTSEALTSQEQHAARFCDFLEASPKQRKKMTVNRNPWLRLYTLTEEEMQFIGKTNRFSGNGLHFCSDIALIPTMPGNGFKEIPLDDAAYNIIVLADGSNTLASLKRHFRKSFTEPLRRQTKRVNDCFSKAISYLLFHGILTIADNSEQIKASTAPTGQ